MAEIDEQKQANKQERDPLPRRNFLGPSWRVFAASAAAQGTYLGLRFLASRKAEGCFGEIVTAGLVADFPPMTITPFDIERFFLVRFENDDFLALYSRCTHLACTVSWHEQHQCFMCPCHGSEFQWSEPC